jgi:hypothetical protein
MARESRSVRPFTGAEFLKALSEEDVLDPIVKIGIIDRDATEGNALAFSEGTSGESWTNIPVDMIEKVEHIFDIRLRDRDFPLVELHFKEPSSDNLAASVLASLLRTAHGSRRRFMPRPPPAESDA